MRGRFITFEGVDGAGKSTHLQDCVQWLRSRGIEVVQTREPGGTPLAEQLRALLLHEPMSESTELLLVFAARADHVQGCIVPALARGAWVVCDRFNDSTVAYQGAGRGMDMAWIDSLVARIESHCRPDRTYLFDLAPEQARARREAARLADRFEGESAAFFERVRAGYLRIAQAEPARVRLIDAGASLDHIGAQWRADLLQWLGDG